MVRSIVDQNVNDGSKPSNRNQESGAVCLAWSAILDSTCRAALHAAVAKRAINRDGDGFDAVDCYNATK
jgi:hypothetical protein